PDRAFGILDPNGRAAQRRPRLVHDGPDNRTACHLRGGAADARERQQQKHHDAPGAGREITQHPNQSSCPESNYGWSAASIAIIVKQVTSTLLSCISSGTVFTQKPSGCCSAIS